MWVCRGGLQRSMGSPSTSYPFLLLGVISVARSSSLRGTNRVRGREEPYL